MRIKLCVYFEHQVDGACISWNNLVDRELRFKFRIVAICVYPSAGGVLLDRERSQAKPIDGNGVTSRVDVAKDGERRDKRTREIVSDRQDKEGYKNHYSHVVVALNIASS
jgi:hypothetical protein